MEFEYINHRKGLPFKLFLVSIGQRSHHFHKDLEVIYVLKGSIHIQMGRERYHLETGAVFLIEPYTIHSIMDNTIHPSENNVLLILQVTDTEFSSAQNLLSKIRFQDYALSDSNAFLKRQMCQMYLESFESEPYTDYFLSSYIMAFLGQLLKTTRYEVLEASKLTTRFEETKRLHFIIDYVENHFQERIQLTDLSSLLHISKYHLSHLIKKHLGINFQTYLNTIRLTHAINLLYATDLSILEIALQSGFSDQKYLNALIKSHYGCTAKVLRLSRNEHMGDKWMTPIGTVHLPFDHKDAMEKIIATLS